MIVDCPRCDLRHVILDRAVGTLAVCECGHEFRLPGQNAEADVIRCGSCGASPPAGSQHCTYCDSHLASTRCARCLAQAIEGDVHCRACGHELGTPVHKLGPAPKDPLACPRCSNTLRAAMAGDVLMDECTRCGGLWLEHDVFREIVARERDREMLFEALSQLGRVRVAQPHTGGDERFYVPCPRCEQIMDRRQFARISKVIVDVCKPHGIWLDHDELPRIVRFVADGGMERAKQVVHERRVAELSRAQRRRGHAVTIERLTDRSGPAPPINEVIAGLLSVLIG